MDYLPEAAYTLMTCRRPLIMDYGIFRRLLILCTNDLPEAADSRLPTGGCLYTNDLPEAPDYGLWYLPEAAYTVH